jgi:eukaryotic-like serine/threonine-protein kinase
LASGPRPRLQRGVRIRDLEVVQFLGSGAYGQVYEVVHPFLGKQALKLIEVGTDAPPVDELLAEAHVLAKIVHPNVVRLFDAGLAEVEGWEQPFLTMELMLGGTLGALQRRRLRLEIDEALDMGIQLLAGLDAAHALSPPVLHRDITPGNILIADESPVQVKLSDFGLAAHVHPETRLLRAAGTIKYQPPEAALGYATTASDVFAVGLILFELVTGVSAFPIGDSYALGTSVGVAQAIRRTRENPAQPPSRFRASVSPDLDAVMSRALALRPADRFGSAKEFEHALVEMRRSLAVSH